MSTTDADDLTLPPSNPPPYSTTALLAMEKNYGFPPGCFVIKSVATGRLLDVELDDVEDGAEIILWPEKEGSLVEGLRKPEADNQVFFIDTSGALCSRQSGHAIDVEDGRLLLRHRRPMSFPYPNAYSHPLPQFWYSSTTKQILVRFQCDPSFPDLQPNTTPSNAWRQNSYLLSSIPLRKPRTLLENASDVFNSVIASPLSPLASIFGGPSKSATVQEVYNSDIDLREDELLEEDRGEGEEVDDSQEKFRRVRVLTVNSDEEGTAETAQRRRTWEVMPLRRSRALYTR
ncbi:hypothetical protein EW145_g4992 [Phellinidium pouzarii]|uniref:Uncharacterized protein n=1 Tax=Phellinidium pouzarii TaxID=167371 RepID=A0A4S4L6E8_9AGAM|nr:hypothetical protein EW145_g4992 [Phellinidium pouzarii]